MSTAFFQHLVKYTSRKSTCYMVLTKKIKRTVDNNRKRHGSSSSNQKMAQFIKRAVHKLCQTQRYDFNICVDKSRHHKSAKTPSVKDRNMASVSIQTRRYDRGVITTPPSSSAEAPPPSSASPDRTSLDLCRLLSSLTRSSRT